MPDSCSFNLLAVQGVVSCQTQICHLVYDVVGVPQEGVRKAGLEQVHGEPRALLHDQVEEDVDRLPVLDLLPRGHGAPVLRQSQERGTRQSQEFLQPILDVISPTDCEENPERLVDSCRKTMDVVLVTVQLRLEFLFKQ